MILRDIVVPEPLVLGLAFEFAAEPMLAIDPQHDRVVDVNARAALLLGYPRDTLRGIRASVLHPGQLPELVVFSEATEAKGRYWTHSLRPRHADGHLLSLEYSGAAMPVGRAVWLLVTLHDIHERQRRLIDQEADLFMREGVEEWQRVERFFQDIERENRLILNAAGKASMA